MAISSLMQQTALKRIRLYEQGVDPISTQNSDCGVEDVQVEPDQKDDESQAPKKIKQNHLICLLQNHQSAQG